MDCSICLGVVEESVKVDCCQNEFCRSCLSNWTSIRSCCPMCIKPLGDTHTNQLTVQLANTFDDGWLALEQEMEELFRRQHHLQRVLHNQKQLAQRVKSNSLPHASLLFVSEQLQLSQEYELIAQSAIHEGQRGIAVEYMQLVTELILTIEGVFDGKQPICGQNQLSEGEDSRDDEDQSYACKGSRKNIKTAKEKKVRRQKERKTE